MVITKFSLLTAIAGIHIASTNFVEGADSGIRASKNPPSHSRPSRRHLVGVDEANCVLYKAEKDYIDQEGNPSDGESFWGCEFDQGYLQSQLGGKIGGVLRLDGLCNKDIESKGAVSGESILKSNNMIVEEFLDTLEVKLLIEDDPKDVTIEQLPEGDPRHTRNRRRRLLDSTPGTYTGLVVRVIDSQGIVIDRDAVGLSDDVFTDSVSLGTQYSACTKDRYRVVPSSDGGGTGVVDVQVNVNAAQSNSGAIENAAVAEAERLYGSLSSKYNFVMFCLPEGTGNWVAYAYINYWSSFYNNDWCRSVTAQMHEVGHNLGLGHSGIMSDQYGDRSSIMGYSYFGDDTPRMCFNTAKNYQLGWYNDQIDSFNPVNNIGKSQTFTLNGVDDYKSNPNTLISLRLVLDGDSDYYLGYNRATGINSGTQAAQNQVVIVKKDFGGEFGYGTSIRVAALSSNGLWTIQNWNGEQDVDVTVSVQGSIGSNIQDANIMISVSGTPTAPPTPNPTPQSTIAKPPSNPPTLPPVATPTAPPTTNPTLQPTFANSPSNPPTLPPAIEESCDKNVFQLLLVTDQYVAQDETSWTLQDESGTEVASGAMYQPFETYIEPSENSGYCLQPGCYTFTIFDSYGDGICCAFGDGFYIGRLDGQNIPGFVGGAFQAQTDVRNFCIEGNNDPSPTPIPTTKPPTSEPTTAPSAFEDSTMCVDDPTFRWKGKKKLNCNKWAGLNGKPGKRNKKKKRCKKKKDGVKVFDICKETCGKVGLGECSN